MGPYTRLWNQPFPSSSTGYQRLPWKWPRRGHLAASLSLVHRPTIFRRKRHGHHQEYQRVDRLDRGTAIVHFALHMPFWRQPARHLVLLERTTDDCSPSKCDCDSDDVEDATWPRVERGWDKPWNVRLRLLRCWSNSCWKQFRVRHRDRYTTCTTWQNPPIKDFKVSDWDEMNCCPLDTKETYFFAIGTKTYQNL